MNLQRVMAMVMVTLCGGALAIMSGRWVAPAMLWAVGLVGLGGWWTLSLRRTLRLILRLLLALAFAAFSQWANEDPTGSLVVSALSMIYVTPLYFLTLMVLELFLRQKGALPSTIVLYATIIMIFAGGLALERGVVSYLESGRLFLALSLALAGSAMMYLSAARRRVASSRPVGARNAAAAATLVVALLAAAGASELVGRYKKEIYEKLTLWAALIRGNPQMGFDEESRLRSMTNIRMYNAAEVALRVQSAEAPGYLRGRAYVLFDKLHSTWTNPQDWRTLWPWPQRVDGVEPPGDIWNLFWVRRGPQGSWRQLTVHPAAVHTSAVFMPLETTMAVVATQRLREDSAETLSATDMLDDSQYVLYRPMNASPGAPPAPLASRVRSDCLSLPGDLDQRVRDESLRVLNGCRSTGEAIRRIERYFQANFQYHLGVSIPSGEDPLGYFLSEKPPAHCEMFASAAAIMLRCHGVPTRYVTGFVASERNPYGEYWIARNADAHAWVEAWDDQRGWVLVEATPPAGVPGSQQHSSLGYFWDLLGFHLARLLAIVRLEGIKGLLIWLADMLVRLLAALVRGKGLAVVIVLVTVAAWRVLARRRKQQTAGWRHARTELGAMLASADRRVRRLGLRRRGDETLAQFVRRLERAAEQIPAHKVRQAALARWAVGWYRLYQKARYSGAASSDEVQILRSQIPGWFSAVRP
ncbi:MAG: transglutaminase domain-containing protein [Planctomycetaceae bacterium]|nr:transglutaminase domain-containing protein [Planctomycetaceae bacterium]